MKMISQSRAEKIAALYVAANDVWESIANDKSERYDEVGKALGKALDALDGSKRLDNPSQVLVGN
jgi:hypothetical protein